MLRILLGLFFVMAAWGVCSSPACADGGQVRLRQLRGNYEITVFTSPSPLRAGPVDVSVYTQHSGTGQPVLDMPVVVEVTHQDDTQPVLRRTATPEMATNKLFRAAEFDLTLPGWWDVRVECRPSAGSPIVLQFAMEAGPPRPAWLAVWPWYGWPVLVVLLYVVHRILVARDSERRQDRWERMKASRADDLSGN